MRKHISLSVRIFLLIFLVGTVKTVNGQSGCSAVGFKIDANLYSTTGTSDWFLGSGGYQLIDQSNPQVIQSLLQGNTPNPTYIRRQVMPIHSISEGSLASGVYKELVDAIWARDEFGGTGGTDNSIVGQGSKNGDDPNTWTPLVGNVLGKNDLIDVAGHMFRDINTGIGKNNLWFTGLINRAEPNGDAYMDFEFYVSDVSFSPGGSFSSGEIATGGHTPFKMDADGKLTQMGDMLFNLSLTGGGTTASTEIRIWVSLADYTAFKATPKNLPFIFTDNFDGAVTGSLYGYASIALKNGSGNELCGYVNGSGVTPLAPPWGSRTTKSNIWVSSYSEYSVAEMSINLTSFGLDDNFLPGSNTCYFSWRTFIVKTRSSASFTAALKDVAGPYSWGKHEIMANLIGSPSLGCNSPTVKLVVVPSRDDANYVWTTTDGEILGSSTNDTIVVKKAGTYNVTATLDAHDCAATSSIVVSDDLDHIPFAAFSYSASTACYGESNGSVIMSFTGAPGPYLWSWIKSGGGTGSGTGIEISNLALGTYDVTILSQGGNGKGCSKTFTVTINENPALSISATPISPTCYGTASGSINVSVLGGTPGYTYLWNPGAVTTQNRSGLTAGTYDLTVTDSNGCKATKSVTITPPDQILIIPLMTPVTCNGLNNGKISLTTTGGTGTFTYLWNDGSSLQNRTGLAAGSYSVTVTDGNGCTKVSSTINVAEPTAITASASASLISCFGGKSVITVIAEGGTPSLTYSLNGGAYQAGNTFSNISASASPYTISVKDGNNCETTTNVTVTQPSAIVLSATLVAASCVGVADGSINLSVSGGTSPYTYSWTGPGVFTSESNILTSVTSGTYSVVVKDANNCIALLSVTVPFTKPSPVQPGTITQ